jgi:hypothetical protein
MSIKAVEVRRHGYFCGVRVTIDGKKYPRARGVLYPSHDKEACIIAAKKEASVQQLELFDDPNEEQIK